MQYKTVNFCEKISAKTANIYKNEESTYNNHKIIIGDKSVECTNRCTVSKESNNTFKYTINKKDDNNYITEIPNRVNVIPWQYNLSISNIMPNVTAKKLNNNFYAIGAYYVTSKSTKAVTPTEKFDVNLRAILGDREDNKNVVNHGFSTGYDKSSVTNKMYVTEINKNFDGDAVFPVINEQNWNEVSREKGPEDEELDYEYLVYERK